jgi:hypothetical protein
MTPIRLDGSIAVIPQTGFNIGKLLIGAVLLGIFCVRFGGPPYLVAVGAVAIITAPGLAIAAALPAPLRAPILAPALIVIGAAAVGWIQFLVWVLHPIAGLTASAAVIVLSLAGLMRQRDAIASVTGLPMLTFALICLLYFCLAGERGNYADGAIGIAFRFWNTPDNIIPRMFADALMAGIEQLKSVRLADWHLGDRPPLETGMIMPLYRVAAPAAREIAYIALGIAVNGTWVLGLWSLLRAVEVDERRILLTVLAVAACGAVYLNTVYAWPKMIGGALILSCATLLMRTTSTRGAALAGLAGALSLLAHGASAFGLIGLAPILLQKLRARHILPLLAFGAIFVAVYSPWVAYQKAFNPHGDRLVKWHIGGVPVKDSRGTADVIVERYAAAGIAGTIQNKLQNIASMIGITNETPNAGWMASDWLSRVRRLQSNSILPAVGLLMIGIAALAFRREPWIHPVFALIGASTLATVLLEFGDPVIASSQLVVGPMSLLLLWCAAGALVITGMSALAQRIIFGLHFSSFALVWVATLSAGSAHGGATSYAHSLGLMIGAGLTAAGLAYLMTANSPT